MNLTPRFFRQLVIAAFAVPLTWGIVWPFLISDQVRQASQQAAQAAAPGSTMGIVIAVFYLGLFVACVVSSIGLYRFRPWARRATLILTAAGLIGAVALPNVFAAYEIGMSMSKLTPGSDLVTSVSYLLEGAILAIAYFAPPISDRFCAVDEGKLVRRLSATSP
jgi:NhaP-type Na+/H+ or K+/H+ antiporter